MPRRPKISRLPTGGPEVQKAEEQGYRNPDMDDKAREIEQAVGDAKKSRAAPQPQRKREERLVAPPTMGKEVG